MFTLNMLEAFYRLEGLERRYFSVHIAIFYKVAIHSCKDFCFFFFFFCKLRHGIFCILFLYFFFFTKCTVLNGDVANNYVLGL